MNIVELNHMSDREINRLIDTEGGVHVSILMPVTPEPDKRDLNRIRLKNLVQETRKKLDRLGVQQPDIDQLLFPVKDLLNEGRFADSRSRALAVYLSGAYTRSYLLPISLEIAVSVGPNFFLKPLMPLRLNEYFFVLAISQQEVRLLRATQHAVEPLDLGEVPTNMEDALQWDDPQRELQWHSQSGLGGGRTAIFHGHGVGTKEIHKENLLRYFRILDQHISEVLTGEDGPLVLAGVDYLLPIYREANSYPYLIEEGIEGSHQQHSDSALQQEAWKLVQPLFRQNREDARSLYYQQLSRGLSSADLATIIPAAHQGRVEILFVASDREVWGRFDPENIDLERRSNALPDDIDLLNLAAIYTVMNSGVVYADRYKELPDEEALAAVFRY